MGITLHKTSNSRSLSTLRPLSPQKHVSKNMNTCARQGISMRLSPGNSSRCATTDSNLSWKLVTGYNYCEIFHYLWHRKMISDLYFISYFSYTLGWWTSRSTMDRNTQTLKTLLQLLSPSQETNGQVWRMEESTSWRYGATLPSKLIS